MKNRTLLTAALATTMLVGSFGIASAAEVGDESTAANNQTQCSQAGGTYVAGTTGQNSTPNTCTIEEDGVLVVFENAGNSENGWSSEISSVIVVEKGNGPGVVTEVFEEVVACYNPGGKLMKPGTGKC